MGLGVREKGSMKINEEGKGVMGWGEDVVGRDGTVRVLTTLFMTAN